MYDLIRPKKRGFIPSNLLTAKTLPPKSPQNQPRTILSAPYNTAIEIKRSSNQDLLHGYRQQLAAYMRAENADNGIFIVIMEDNNIDEIKDKIRMVQEDMQANGEYIPEVFYINGMKQPSASDPSYDSPTLS